MNKLFASIIVLLLAISCTKDQPIVVIPTPSLDFGNMKIGDEMSFLRFESSCDDFQGDFKYTGDTLKWIVTALDGNSGILTERFSKNSPLAPDFPDVEMTIEPNAEFLIMPDRWSSNLFFFYGNDTLWVNPTASVELIQDNCQLKVGGDGFRGDAIATINQIKLPDHEFDNMTVVSCVPGSVRDAYIIYKDGKIKVIYNVDWFSGVPSGWVAMD